ncbi:MAG: 2,4-dienoyl-CoA reductase, partial [Paenibacillaceae bacterium]|nr:2,4-dienoyl-CoA reductase [Paenibacillaceae bacterium]
VVVVGGGAVGLDVVEYMAPRGAKVFIVEMMPDIGKDLDPVSKSGINAMMKKYEVVQLTGATLTEVRESSFLISQNGTETELPFDYGFVCLGMRANTPVINDLHQAFDDTDAEIINIGDSVRARRIIDGIQEGRNLLNTLERKDFL